MTNTEEYIGVEVTPGIAFIATNFSQAIKDAKTNGEMMQQLLMFAGLCRVAEDKIIVKEKDKPRLQELLTTSERLAQEALSSRDRS